MLIMQQLKNNTIAVKKCLQCGKDAMKQNIKTTETTKSKIVAIIKGEVVYKEYTEKYYLWKCEHCENEVKDFIL